MSAKRIDITIWQGSKWYPIFTWTDDEGDPVDITGWSGKMDIRHSEDSESDQIFTCRTADGNLDIQGELGIFRPKITATESSQFDFEWAYYDIILTPPSGAADNKIVVEGKIELNKKVTA